MFRSIINTNKEGNRLLDVPKCVYNYITIFNDTHFDFTLYKGYTEDEEEIIGSCPAYTMLTFPIDKSADTINIVWRGSARKDFEKCMMFFTEDNLGISSTFNPPRLEGIGSTTTRIVASDVILPIDIQTILREQLFSTITPLGVGEVYLSPHFDLLTWKHVTGILTSDQAGIMTIEESCDNINFIETRTYSLPIGGQYDFVEQLHARFVRFRFVNGAVAQSTFSFCGYARVI